MVLLPSALDIAPLSNDDRAVVLVEAEVDVPNQGPRRIRTIVVERGEGDLYTYKLDLGAAGEGENAGLEEFRIPGVSVTPWGLEYLSVGQIEEMAYQRRKKGPDEDTLAFAYTAEKHGEEKIKDAFKESEDQTASRSVFGPYAKVQRNRRERPGG